MEAPERIYLQIESEDCFTDEQIVEDISDATWYVGRIHESDVEYVRQDVAIGLREMVEDLLGYATEAGRPGRDRAAQIMLAETDWLVDEVGKEGEL